MSEKQYRFNHKSTEVLATNLAGATNINTTQTLITCPSDDRATFADAITDMLVKEAAFLLLATGTDPKEVANKLQESARLWAEHYQACGDCKRDVANAIKDLKTVDAMAYAGAEEKKNLWPNATPKLSGFAETSLRPCGTLRKRQTEP